MEHPITILCVSRYLSGGFSTTLPPKPFELKPVNFPFSQNTHVFDINNWKSKISQVHDAL